MLDHVLDVLSAEFTDEDAPSDEEADGDEEAPAEPASETGEED